MPKYGRPARMSAAAEMATAAPASNGVEVPEDERSEAENSLIAERLQNYFSLLGDDMSKVKHIKNLTSDEVSVTDAALVMIWKELHELNAKMN